MILIGEKMYFLTISEEKDFLNYFGFWSFKFFMSNIVVCKISKKLKKERLNANRSINAKIKIQKLFFLDPINVK